ncbi:terpenoid cyclases/protein prenyltransferase alpha-alpha toroid [Kockovaella imperatae]|uniref:Terpene cyclase/mutase family member n=1 Tax=Kockovaella imperatae TaxID=4999 RepID=A0A1Y1UQ10_9TREE|nr:terpenoid cyclases/protein prenyltransferase alpha-alpha toroid [Kockovaella imperatae]ORX40148.1 terpenoid cyclases/protein prenyltransferase alpha-alpha toroid [Kockovaella imperatae]
MSSYTPRKTDYAGWRLKVSEDSHGQHKWVYLPEGEARDAWPQNKIDKYWLGLEVDAPKLKKAKTPLEAARNGAKFFKQLQSEDGHWAAEYGGPLFLTPGLVIAMHVTRQTFKQEERTEMIRYLLNRRKPDGGWGLHTAAPATAYGTVMNYVTLRLLGMGPDEGPMAEIRGLIHRMGGAVRVPSWAKLWLSVLGAYEWDGVGSVPPELWLLPDWVPFAPSRFWIHVRMTFTPMSYLCGSRYVGQLDPLVLALREELYITPYESIHWSRHRNDIHEADIYNPHSFILNTLHTFLGYYESALRLPGVSSILPIRQKALAAAYQQVVYEDENTTYQTLGPVSKSFNLVVRYTVDGPESEAFKMHLSRVRDFLWLSRDGMFMTGTNGSQLWDLAFFGQAMVETGLAEEEENKECVLGMLDWLDKAQIRDNPKWYKVAHRHRTKGAWAFSTPEQGYTVSDCVSEGLKAVMGIQNLDYAPKTVSLDRMRDAIDTILSMQNANGGYASYELKRGSDKMEYLNAAEVFGDIMVDYLYPECTTSALSALKYFSQLDPTYRTNDVARTIDKAIHWLHSVQRPDGSWYGSWGVCFTYATMFALESLGIAGETYENSTRVKKACEFLISKQKEDGGWGETYMSCVTLEYCQHEMSQVVMTSWAILALIYGKCPNKDVIKRGIRLLMERQKPDGRWEREDTEGIFNKNCAIDYTVFQFVFPIWALGRADKYLNE